MSALRPDAVLIVADATALGRALYLAGEIIDTGARIVIALNMVDEARAQRLAIDEARLATSLGVPVVPIVARSRQGLEPLRRAAGRPRCRRRARVADAGDIAAAGGARCRCARGHRQAGTAGAW